jgi:hypothetical protein
LTAAAPRIAGGGPRSAETSRRTPDRQRIDPMREEPALTLAGNPAV